MLRNPSTCVAANLSPHITPVNVSIFVTRDRMGGPGFIVFSAQGLNQPGGPWRLPFRPTRVLEASCLGGR